MQIAAQDVLDMPVDPNEPTYCLCHQVSYGEMIGCDNPDVSFVFIFFVSHGNSVSYRMVSFWMCRIESKTQGKMVLRAL